MGDFHRFYDRRELTTVREKGRQVQEIEQRLMTLRDDPLYAQETPMKREQREQAERRRVLREFMYAPIPSQLQLGVPAEEAPDQAQAYSKWKAKKKRKSYSKAAGKGKQLEEDLDIEKFAASKYMETLRSKTVKDCGNYIHNQGELFEACRQGNFSDFEKLDDVMRDALAKDFMKEKMPALIYNGSQLLTPEQVVSKINSELGHEGLAHPLMRLGISLGMKGGFTDPLTPEYCRKLDEAFNTQIMRNTLTSLPTPQEVISLDVPNESMLRDLESRKYICKSLLLAHLGTFTEKVKSTKKVAGYEKKWEGNVADAFAHCSRVLYTLPSELTASPEAATRFREAYVGKDKGRSDPAIGFRERKAATHRAVASKKDKAAREQKFKVGWYFDQDGINVAVGGLGKKGIGGRQLQNDGSCGHLYRYYTEGNAERGGVMMLGFESDAYKKKNQLGHTHGLGNGEKASSFGGQRVDEIGDKYGGRVVDVSHVDAEAMADVMDKITELFNFGEYSMANMFSHIILRADHDYRQKLDRIVELLTGKIMDDTKLQELLSLLYQDPEQETIVFNRLRGIA